MSCTRTWRSTTPSSARSTAIRAAPRPTRVGSAIAIDADRALLLGRQVLKELQRAATDHA
ncbi:MAG: hypothetical protein WDO24_11265 [Pseudomonadota bacterium]